MEGKQKGDSWLHIIGSQAPPVFSQPHHKAPPSSYIVLVKFLTLLSNSVPEEFLSLLNSSAIPILVLRFLLYFLNLITKLLHLLILFLWMLEKDKSCKSNNILLFFLHNCYPIVTFKD